MTFRFLVLWLSCSIASAAIEGQWRLSKLPDDTRWRLTLRQSGSLVNPTHAIDVNPEELIGFDPAKQDTQFRVSRDAGDLLFSGTPTSGDFHFTENASFLAALRMLASDASDPLRLYEMALSRVPLAYVQNLRKLGYQNLSGFDVLRMYQNDVSIEWLSQTQKAGRLPTPGEAVQSKLFPGEREALQVHGISPEYLQRLRESGYPVFPEDAARLKAYGVTPDLLRQLHQSGYETFSVNDMLKLQTNGVNSFDVQQMQMRGLRNLTPDEMIRLKQNGIQ